MHVVAHRQIRTVLEQQIHHLFVSVVRGKVQSGCVVWNSAHPRPPVEQKRDGCLVLVEGKCRDVGGRFSLESGGIRPYWNSLLLILSPSRWIGTIRGITHPSIGDKIP